MGDRDAIDDIRRALAVPREVATMLNLRGRIEGRGFKVLCPAHGDRTPSLSLTVGDDGTLRVRCFGCDLSGDIFSLVAAVERVDIERDFPAVLTAAARLAGIDLPANRNDYQARPRLPAPPPFPPGPPPLRDERFAEIVAPLLHMGRLDTAEDIAERGGSFICGDVCDYLDGRGLLDLARTEGWAALPPPGPSQASWVAMLIELFGEEDVARTGLVPLDDDGRIIPRGFVQSAARLVIPWRRPDGVVTTLQRRRLDDGKPKYVSPIGRAPRFPYGVERLAGAAHDCPVAFCEGALDAVALCELQRRAGVRCVTLGVQGITGWQKEWGEYARLRASAIAFDNVPTDSSPASERKVLAMQKATERITLDLIAWGAMSIARWLPGDGAKDWSDALVAPAMKGAA